MDADTALPLGIVLLGHGARDPDWAAPLMHVKAKIEAASPSVTVVLAFLEGIEPDLGGAVAALRTRGCKTVRVVPMFLGQGGHVRRDIPQAIAQARGRWPEIAIHLTATVGEDDGVLSAMAAFCLQAFPT